MSTTMLVATLLFPAVGFITLAMFINPGRMRSLAQDLKKSASLVYVASFMSLLGGTAIMIYHNVWARDWAVVITIIGWLSFIKGALYLLVPMAMTDMAARWVKSNTAIYVRAVIAAIITIILFSMSSLVVNPM